MTGNEVRCTVAHPRGATMQREAPEGATGNATSLQPTGLKAAAQRVLSRNETRNKAATKGPQRVQREGGTETPFVAQHGALIQQAAEAADLAPDTLAALLSAEDREDLGAGLLRLDELTAFARAVVERWHGGEILPDERELAAAERVRRDPLAGLPLLREDRAYIERQLARLPDRDRHGLLMEYRSRWLVAADADPSEVRRDNAGRHAANTWIREEARR